MPGKKPEDEVVFAHLRNNLCVQNTKNTKILQASYRVFMLVACKNWSNTSGWYQASLQTNLCFQSLLVQSLHYLGTVKTDSKLFLMMALVKPTFISVQMLTNIPHILWLQQVRGGGQKRSQGGSWQDPNSSWWPHIGALLVAKAAWKQGRLQG